MENVVLTQLSVSEIKTIINEVVEGVFVKHQSQAIREEAQHIFFNLQETCKFLEIAPPTLYRYTSKNTIPHIKKGKKLFFLKADLLEWLKEGKKVSASCPEKENISDLKLEKELK